MPQGILDGIYRDGDTGLAVAMVGFGRFLVGWMYPQTQRQPTGQAPLPGWYGRRGLFPGVWRVGAGSCGLKRFQQMDWLGRLKECGQYCGGS